MTSTTFEEFKNYFFNQLEKSFPVPAGFTTDKEVSDILAKQYRYIDLLRRYPEDDCGDHVVRIGDTARALGKYFPNNADYGVVIYHIINRKVNNSLDTTIKVDLKRALAETLFKYTILNDDKVLAEAANVIMRLSEQSVDDAFYYHIGKLTFDEFCRRVAKCL